MRHRVLLAIATIAAASGVYACAEATDGAFESNPTTGQSDANGDAGKADDKDDDGDGKPDEKDAGPAVFEAGAAEFVLINEISAGEEWVELVNASSGAVDISGYAVADFDKDTNGPKVGEAAKLPIGTILSPNSYIIVKGGGVDSGETCPAGGQSYCVFADWGISNKSGETIFFLAPNGAVISKVEYPPSAAAKDESWSRSPSGDPKGTFGVGVPTPGAANQAP